MIRTAMTYINAFRNINFGPATPVLGIFAVGAGLRLIVGYLGQQRIELAANSARLTDLDQVIYSRELRLQELRNATEPAGPPYPAAADIDPLSRHEVDTDDDRGAP